MFTYHTPWIITSTERFMRMDQATLIRYGSASQLRKNNFCRFYSLSLAFTLSKSVEDLDILIFGSVHRLPLFSGLSDLIVRT